MIEHIDKKVDKKQTNHTLYGMKMTMHINEELLTRVMDLYGCTSKTETVDLALKEMERKHKLREFAETGLGFSPEELRNAVDPNYDVLESRIGTTTLKAAEESESYGKRDPR